MAPIRLYSYDDRRYVHIVSDRLARLVTGAIAVLIAFGIARWAVEAYNRFGVPDDIRPFWFRVPQLSLAIAGVLVAAVEMAYLSYFTASGRIWRRFRGVTLVFAAFATIWTAIWFIDRLALDHIFLG